jgi:hypothetical protein
MMGTLVSHPSSSTHVQLLTIRCSTLPVETGGYRSKGDPAFVTSRSQAFGNSSNRIDYTNPEPDVWKRPTTSRFGMSNKPWAAKQQAAGIVPVIPLTGDLMHHARTRTSMQDSTRAPHPILDRAATRAGNIAQGGAAVLTGADEDDIITMVNSEAQHHVAAWLESAPLFEGEVIKRLMRDVSSVLREQQAGGDGSVGAFAASINLPARKTSKWTGDVTTV